MECETLESFFKFHNSTFNLYIYETETVTSGLCYIEDLIFLENNIVWFWNPIVLWNYIIYFHIRGYFLITFCTSFWKRVHNSKEIVNLQGFVCFDRWLRRYDHIPLRKYYYVIKRVYFIYKLFPFLSVHFHSCSFQYSVTEV